MQAGFHGFFAQAAPSSIYKVASCDATTVTTCRCRSTGAATQIRCLAAELKILRDAERAARCVFDADVPIEIDFDGGAEIVVAEG